MICDKCMHAALYKGEKIRSPNDVVLDCDGKCQNRGKKLSFVPINVEIRAITGPKQQTPACMRARARLSLEEHKT